MSVDKSEDLCVALCALSDAAVDLGHVIAPLPGICIVPQAFRDDLIEILAITGKWIAWAEEMELRQN
jgi:hypothetical protein